MQSDTQNRPRIENPILPGFNPDPSILRRGDWYYLATSTFEWFPGVAIYRSRDLAAWELFTHALTDEDSLDLRKLPSAKGIWAPCLTWSESEGLFYLLYTRMISHNARFFDQDNFLVAAPEIDGPWSEPVYLNSIGFDPSILHDDDGKKYIVSLEWETRDGYEKPGVIAIQEYDAKDKTVVGYAKRIWRGGTDRGCIEGPHLYKLKGRYYLMTAEGGTGYGHCVAMARSDSPWGPFERDPANPILTATGDFYGRDSDWFLKTERYNPDSYLQKVGHGSIVETPDGRWYLAHLCSRPFAPELRCTLGRETGIQEMKWTDDGWLRLAGGGNCAQKIIEGPGAVNSRSGSLVSLAGGDALLGADGPELGAVSSVSRTGVQSSRNDFDGPWDPCLVSPRTDFRRWSSPAERPGWLRIRGQQSLASQDRVSLVARRLTSVNASISCKMEFDPEVWQQSAGLVLYYDNMNWIWLRVYFSQTLGGKALALMRCENGEMRELSETRVRLPVLVGDEHPAGDKDLATEKTLDACDNASARNSHAGRKQTDEPIWLRLTVVGRETRFWYSLEDPDAALCWLPAGPVWDTTEFSDEYCAFGEFTGTFAGIACVDSNRRTAYADFDWFEYHEPFDPAHGSGPGDFPR